MKVDSYLCSKDLMTYIVYKPNVLIYMPKQHSSWHRLCITITYYVTYFKYWDISILRPADRFTFLTLGPRLSLSSNNIKCKKYKNKVNSFQYIQLCRLAMAPFLNTVSAPALTTVTNQKLFFCLWDEVSARERLILKQYFLIIPCLNL